ncbi:hypothetical protein E2320_003100 [Naja naja]|nr:hypothetical protein E2320_003100 [Naja naja]
MTHVSLGLANIPCQSPLDSSPDPQTRPPWLPPSSPPPISFPLSHAWNSLPLPFHPASRPPKEPHSDSEVPGTVLQIHSFFQTALSQTQGLSLCIMGVSRGCLLCVKVKMFLFNLIFWLGGCGVLGVGIWLAATQGRFATLSFSFPSLSAAGLFMATGAIIMVVGFLGCLGAATEHRCLLLTFFTVLSILFLLELVGLLVFFTCRDKVLGIVFSMLMYCQVRRVEKYYD